MISGGALIALFAFVCALPGAAHHGWSWTTGKDISLSGIVREVKLGNPHGILKVEAEGEVWTVEVGQPWRNERAGLKDGDLTVGVELRIEGEPSADPGQKLLKAERLYIGERSFNLYPDRD
jgi:hypothetical protein